MAAAAVFKLVVSVEVFKIKTSQVVFHIVLIYLVMFHDSKNIFVNMNKSLKKVATSLLGSTRLDQF